MREKTLRKFAGLMPHLDPDRESRCCRRNAGPENEAQERSVQNRRATPPSPALSALPAGSAERKEETPFRRHALPPGQHCSAADEALRTILNQWRPRRRKAVSETRVPEIPPPLRLPSRRKNKNDIFTLSESAGLKKTQVVLNLIVHIWNRTEILFTRR